jgi:hypothetical protein
MKIGDVSRPRRFADPVRQRWYAYHRAVRFALRVWQTTLAVSRLPGGLGRPLECRVG